MQYGYIKYNKRETSVYTFSESAKKVSSQNIKKSKYFFQIYGPNKNYQIGEKMCHYVCSNTKFSEL